MRPLLVLLTIMVLDVNLIACGDAGKRMGAASQASTNPPVTGGAAARAVSRATPTGRYLKGDDDSDAANPSESDSDDYRIRSFGHATSAANRRAIAALVKRYYTAAAAGDGARACSLIYSGLAKSSNLGEMVEAVYPPAPSVPPLRGESCARIMSLLFTEHRQALAADVATVEVTRVGVDGNRGLALLGFRTTPERQIAVLREHHTWKIDSLLDEELP